jgi:small subunit ribosomal protein S4
MDLHGLTRKRIDRRPYPPGESTASRRRRRLSEYALRLREKQRLRYYYGVSEGQLRRYVRRAASKPGPTGVNLLSTLERRLDNVVFRLGLAPTVPAARQLVSHGHILINGKRVTAPAYEVDPGDDVRAHERAHGHPLVRQGVEQGPQLGLPSYLERAADRLGGRVVAEPTRMDSALDIDETLVVEFYAR